MLFQFVTVTQVVAMGAVIVGGERGGERKRERDRDRDKAVIIIIILLKRLS